MTEQEISAATAAIRKMINDYAGFYARMVTDEACRELAIAALKAAEEVKT